ncbi:AGBL2_3 [Mytilus coruscus]|uniref:AGBL2_3 n=1 Tax=Mytilus coruscus TaxID=42192 RepID=A0A6J8BHD4_MYTCO|nr:AGBL2_3 [Mytilus coruscus]
MKILNSFTLEATFSGTIMNKNEYRHFNVHDFQEMGKVLSQTVLEYQKTQENNARTLFENYESSFVNYFSNDQIYTKTGNSEMKLEQQDMLIQVMEQRGLMERPKLPNFRSMMKGDKNVINNTDTGNDSSQEKTTPEPHVSTPVFKEAVLTVMDHENNTFVMEEKRGKRSKKSEKAQSNLSRKDVDNLLENASLKTMDGCLKILAQLNVREVMQESDSSDSDSESEPEMKIMETKSKKKKRKSRKQRDKEQADRKNGSGSSDKKQEEVRSKSLTALPNIPACSELSDRDKGDKSLPKQTTTSFEKFMRSQKKDAHFVSKYEGRRNGGIPCFAEERSIERAQKRMADMKKRTEEDKQREMAFFCNEEDGMYNHQIMSLRRSLTQDDLKHRLQVALHEGSANIAQTLVGLNVRTAYTHADAFRDMNSTMPSLPQPRDIRSGPISRTSRRQSTPSITFNNTPPIIFPVTDEIKTEKRPRITPNAGPLIRGIKVKTES